jgi:hypothetical protein
MTTDLTLKDRITSVLVAAGFTNSLDAGSAHGPAFVVTPGVGATVSIMWWDAPDDERALLFTKYENRLRGNGLQVTNRGSHLYVAEPAPVREETPHEH